MKIYRASYILILTIFLLSSCGSKKLLVQNNVNSSTEKIVAKKGTLSELELQEWPYADLSTDSIPGISLLKDQSFLKNKKATPIIVGVIDSGVDIEHKGLFDFIWKNEGEIPNNKKDDDHNGFIDDISGWNFLGSTNGNNMCLAQFELTRLIKKYESKTIDEIIETSQEDYNAYRQQKELFNGLSNNVKESYQNIIKQQVSNPNDDNLKEALVQLEKYKTYRYNLEFSPRDIVGDNPEDILDTNYGNPDVIGFRDKESHGTHVTGIIATIIYKSKELDNEAIKIMPIRTIPDGDEYDKDVALAIRYAVNNGAKVINMSFGKAYSAHASWVYEAIEYAKKHDVLLIMGAGNDSSNIDNTTRYPNDNTNSDFEFTNNLITVGAITHNFNNDLVSEFSNYGKKNVDVFAPGSKIYSAVPNNEYRFQNGTSMAAPMVSGVAALIRSYYPTLTAGQVKQIILDSGIFVDFDVRKPGIMGGKKMFSELSVSGKILNAYNALLMANDIFNETK